MANLYGTATVGRLRRRIASAQMDGAGEHYAATFGYGRPALRGYRFEKGLAAHRRLDYWHAVWMAS